MKLIFSYIHLLFVFSYYAKCLFMSLANFGEGLCVYYSFVEVILYYSYCFLISCIC